MPTNTFPERGEIWVNFKHRIEYKILDDCATDCTNERVGTQVVIYSRVDSAEGICVRERQEFVQKFYKKGSI